MGPHNFPNSDSKLLTQDSKKTGEWLTRHMMCLTDEVTQLASQTASLLILIAAGLFEYMLGVNSEFIPTEH